MNEFNNVEIISIPINDDIQEGNDIVNLILESLKEKTRVFKRE